MRGTPVGYSSNICNGEIANFWILLCQRYQKHYIQIKIYSKIQLNLIKNSQMSLLAVGAGLVVVYLLVMISGFYSIKEGEIGLLKEFGVLKKDLIEPGMHFRVLGYQQVIRINLMIQTDIVQKVPCGTSNGLLITFDKIEVINRLDKKHVFKTVLNYTQQYESIWITDKIHHEINQFCSKHTLQQIYIDLFDRLDEELMKSLNKDLRVWAPGIEILSVRTTKPTIPNTILRNVEEMQKKKVEFLIALQKEKVVLQQKKTNQTQRKIAAQSMLSVKKIQLQKMLKTKRNSLNMAKIQAKIIEQRQKTLIETQFMAAFQEASLYPELFTQDYLRYLASQALTTNLTIVSGDKVPNIAVDWGKSLKGKK